jgi:hypothetical protein
LEFQLRAYVDDLRGEPGRPPLNNAEFPVASAAQQGVFSAYMDLLYEAGYVAYSGDNRLTFGPAYNQGQFVNSSIPGILDEIGALQGTTTPLGPNEQLLYARHVHRRLRKATGQRIPRRPGGRAAVARDVGELPREGRAVSADRFRDRLGRDRRCAQVGQIELVATT